MRARSRPDRRGWLACAVAAAATASCASSAGPLDAHASDVAVLDAPQPDAPQPDASDASLPPGDVGDQCLPPCLTRLIGDCVAGPSCVADGNWRDPQGYRTCYSNGVATRELATSDPMRTLVTWSRGGVVCFIEDIDVYEPGHDRVVYMAPDGGVVAREQSLTGSLAAITCDGATYTVDTLRPACQTYYGGPTPDDCDAGTCTP